MRTDLLTMEIEWLTRGVRAIRISHQLRKQEMARLIEIKGLGNIVAEAKKGIGELRTSAGALNTETTGLKAEIDDLTAQVKQHRADLRFEAETLGNGNGGGSDGQSEKPAGQPPQAEQTVTEPPAPLPVAPPDVVHAFEIALPPPEPQITPQDPARAMVR
jgi:hypothetical protein